ncbi:MAG: hypothetical protein QOF78_2998 [Phycisphaerales bacterium]|nr:hypothetical protein [Phycisphaerales bacterium]
MRWLWMILGGLLFGLVLADVFLTVLYARMGNGVISRRVACWTWYVFRAVARPFPRYRDGLLSFCGPTILVLVVFGWIFLLMWAGAMVIYPALGTGVQANQGPTPTQFSTALYVAGDTLTTVGASDISPKTPFYRLFYTFLSVIGISVLTLTVTYFLEVYTALQERNTYVSKLHHATNDTGDAVEVLAGLGSGGEFNHGYSHLVEMGAEAATIYEAHHFYPIILYFRFREPHYALSRAALVTLELITLIKSALDDQRYAWLKESAAVTQVWSAAMRTVAELAIVFLPGGLPQGEPTAEAIDRWRRRYHAARARLRQAGIQTMSDADAGEAVYINLRARWDRYIVVFADHMLEEMEVIDPAGTHPESLADRPDFRERLRAVG